MGTPRGRVRFITIYFQNVSSPFFLRGHSIAWVPPREASRGALLPTYAVPYLPCCRRIGNMYEPDSPNQRRPS